MTLVLVHGVPETAAIWDDLIAALDRDDVVTLSPPGFGAPVPDGFDATSDAYRDWLVRELEGFDEPVDLVGHDWGGGHALRATTARPDLVRTFVTDIAGCSHANYRWHDLAQLWQTEGEGESVVAAMAEMPVEARAAGLIDAGMTPDAAHACAAAGGEEMGSCILSLYRSAKQPKMALFGDQFHELDDRPDTLVIIPTEDPYTGGPDLARRMAEKWDATVAELDGLGHWWMMQDPARGAAALSTSLG